MQPTLLAGFLLFALALLALARWRAAGPLAEGAPGHWPMEPGDDREEQPETDRAPLRAWPLGPAAVGAARPDRRGGRDDAGAAGLPGRAARLARFLAGCRDCVPAGWRDCVLAGGGARR